MRPFISICIPTYKNVAFLKRLLDSIVQQDYTNFEVIITDDSPDQQVQQLVNSYQEQISQLHYSKNEPAEGMPKNWNAALKRANGEWIKIMHDDDWFSRPDSLSLFAKETDTDGDFIFSQYENYYLDAQGQTINTELMVFPMKDSDLITREPLVLLANNCIGPPSVCMIRADAQVFYDPRLQWRVDIDYYARVLKQNPKFICIEQSLVAVGMNPDQVTNITKNKPEVELPEAFVLLEKYGTRPLDYWQVYDAWWRMLRNMQIYSRNRLLQYVDKDWHPAVLNMVDFIHRTPKFLLKAGVTSKVFMVLSFLTNRGRRSVKS